MNDVSLIRCGKRAIDGESEYMLTVDGRSSGTPLTLSEAIAVLRMVESEEAKHASA